MKSSRNRALEPGCVAAMVCIVFALASAAQAQCPGDGDCCVANPTPGCDDELCCSLVCAQAPLCCVAEWDEDCAAIAAAACENCMQGGLCEGGTGDCCEANGTPGCDDPECCEAHCAIDPFCCDTEWDQICADDAAEGVCSKLCNIVIDCSGGGCCYAANGTPGCDVEACCQTVCAADAFCCETEWDGQCAETALDLCVNADCPGDTNADFTVDVQDLTEVILTWGTDAASGDVDYSCLVDVADLTVVILGWGSCSPFEGCGEPGSGDCCQPTGSPSCDDIACCTTVCNFDAFCCETEWDGICAGLAGDMCGDLCPELECGSPGTGDCFEATGTPFCEDVECCELICAGDAFCCDTEWDQICADDALANCETPPSACCLDDGSCVDGLTGSECLAQGGTYQGGDSTCGEVECIQPGACCIGQTCEEGLSPATCADIGGSFMGSGTACADIECPDCGNEAAGDCCSATGTPYCDDLECCKAHCAIDPFCCDVEWDQICADDAAAGVCVKLCGP